MPRGVTFVVALPAVLLIFTRANVQYRPQWHHPNTYISLSRVLLPSNDWHRYGRLGKIHFPMAQHPRLRPHFTAMLQNRRSAVPSCHAASSYDSAIAMANRIAWRMRVGAHPRPNCRQRRASAEYELDYRSSFFVPRQSSSFVKRVIIFSESKGQCEVKSCVLFIYLY